MSKFKMNAVVPLLERNVQWFVIVIAAGYVGLMAYWYIVTPPLTVTLGQGARTKVLLPGNIDPTIVKDVVEPLRKEFLDPTVDAPKLLNVVTELQPYIDLRNAEVLALRTPFFAPHVRPGTIDAAPDQNAVDPTLVDALPKLSPAKPDGFTEGWTVITTGTPPGVRSDLGYITLRFMPDWQFIVNEFTQKFGKKGNLAPGLLVPQFAHVDLLREELQSDGKTWSAPQVVPAISLTPAPEFPNQLILDNGGKKENIEALLSYQRWANDHQDVLINPPFFSTAPDAPAHLNPQGTHPAAGAAPSAGTPGAGVDPSAPGAVASNTPAGAVPPGTVPPGTVSAGAPDAPGAAAQGTAAPGAVAPGSAAPGAAAPGGAVAGAGAAAALDTPIICHDTTVQEGKFYRYAVRYRLLNAVYHTSKVAQKELTLKFTLDSPDPAAATDAQDPKSPLWTDKISLEPSVRVFVTKINVPGGSAQFDVFEWKNGHWGRSATPMVMSGDPIATAKGTPSRWTLVDVRNDPRKHAGLLVGYVVLTDSNGTLYQHDKATDENDPDYAKLKSETEATATLIAPH